MIKLKNVSKIYYNNGVVGTGFSKISLEFKIGEFIAIAGESGSGKSTLLNVISGLDTYEEGEMYINGEETSHYSEEDFEEYRRKYIANIFQGFNLVNSYTVRQNIELVLLIHGFSRKDTRKKVDDIIHKVGLWEFRNKRVSKLSGGQKQRVAIARALAKETPIIVADEPTGNLDSESSKQIIKLLHDISKDKLVVIVTHNFEQVEKYVTRVIRMHDGRVVDDNLISKAKEVPAVPSEHSKMSFISKIRLAFRNTFNILGKFLLILGVFVLCVDGVLSDLGKKNKSSLDEILSNISYIFVDNNPSRIIIKHKDKSIISDEDYEKIENLNNVERIVENDIVLDTNIQFQGKNSGIYLSSILYDIEDLDIELKKGKMPEKDNEGVLVLSSDDLYFSYFDNEVLDDIFYVTNNMGENVGNGLKIVGIAESTDTFTYYKVYTKKSNIKPYQDIAKIIYSDSIVTINNNTHNKNEGILVLSDKVPSNTLYVSEGLNFECKNNNCLNSTVNIKLENIYTSSEINLEVSKVLNKKAITDIFGSDLYDSYNSQVFMNINDYIKINNLDGYQSSVFASDIKYVDSLARDLKNLGFEVYPIKDLRNMNVSDLNKIVKLFSLIGSIFTFICLYLISYFVITLILKSRNTYFAIVRILGGNIKLCKQLLDIELFIVSTIAFVLVTTLTLLFKYNVINYDILGGIMNYIEWYHYLISYLLIILLSQLISSKYSKKLFKTSMINAYNMEV